jgi:hypothetical protein
VKLTSLFSRSRTVSEINLFAATRKLAALVLISTVAAMAGGPQAAQANGGGMGHGGGSGMGHGGGGAMGHGGISMGHGGVGSYGGRVGGNWGSQTGSFGGNPQFPSQHGTFTPYFRQGPQSPWMPYGTFQSQQDALRVRQAMEQFGYDAFIRSR